MKKVGCSVIESGLSVLGSSDPGVMRANTPRKCGAENRPQSSLHHPKAARGAGAEPLHCSQRQ